MGLISRKSTPRSFGQKRDTHFDDERWQAVWLSDGNANGRDAHGKVDRIWRKGTMVSVKMVVG